MFHISKRIIPKFKTGGGRYDSNLFFQLFISLVGTVLGILLTVGITYYSDKHEKEVMARKVIMLTIHNLDVSINGMEQLVDELDAQDSIFNYVREKHILKAAISADTLELFISALYSHRIRPIDTSTEAIFSSNFEIWKYIDDPKVIGRIANSYSLMNKCGEEYGRVEKEKYESFLSVYDQLNSYQLQSDSELVDELLKESKVLRVIDALPSEIALLRQLVKNAKALNNRNKSYLKVEQTELDEIGNLM